MSKIEMREKIKKEKIEKIVGSIVRLILLIILSVVFKDNPIIDGLVLYMSISLFVKMVKASVLEVIQVYIYPYIDAKDDEEVSNEQTTETRS